MIGPWVAAGRSSMPVGGSAYLVRTGDGSSILVEQRTDVAIVTAAPDLLDALKDLLAPYNMAEEYQAKIDRARAAITKAEGGAK